jgi:protein-disulfide isomerase
VEPELVERYVENGTLRIEWRDFAYLGQESVKVAKAARAAQEQGRFWEYHDALYENQGSINGGTFSDEKLTDLARGLGLDVESFESELTSGRYEAVVRRDLQEAREAGI